MVVQGKDRIYYLNPTWVFPSGVQLSCNDDGVLVSGTVRSKVISFVRRVGGDLGDNNSDCVAIGQVYLRQLDGRVAAKRGYSIELLRFNPKRLPLIDPVVWEYAWEMGYAPLGGGVGEVIDWLRPIMVVGRKLEAVLEREGYQWVPVSHSF